LSELSKCLLVDHSCFVIATRFLFPKNIDRQ